MNAELTEPQRKILSLAWGGVFVRGADVRVARSLVARGLGTLEDNGSLDGKGNPDGERWLFVAKAAP